MSSIVFKNQKENLFEQGQMGKWYEVYDGYQIGCCDCGLTHKFNFRVVNGKVQIQPFVDWHGTSEVRKLYLARKLVEEKEREHLEASRVKAPEPAPTQHGYPMRKIDELPNEHFDDPDYAMDSDPFDDEIENYDILPPDRV